MVQKRYSIPKPLETYVLVASRRRCCICYFIQGNKLAQKGQIAHLNHNPLDRKASNLVYLCLNHHDEFDSRTSQSKAFSESEVRYYRNELLKVLGTDSLQTPQVASTKDRNGSSQKSKGFYSPNTPWRISWLDEGTPELYAFKAINGCDGICRIERNDLPDGRTLFVCEEIDENPGQSITNSIETIAAQICRRFKIKPTNLVLIEHYRTSYINEDEWNLVKFRALSGKYGFSDPTWHPMSELDWNAFGFQPKLRPTFGFKRTSLLRHISKRAQRGRS